MLIISEQDDPDKIKQKNKKIIMKYLAIKIFAWNFLQLPI